MAGRSQSVARRVPDDWLEDYQGGQRVRNDRKKYLPQPVRVGSDGQRIDLGLDGHYLSAPFRFCLHCGVTYGGRQYNDFAKLSSLASEGRSTATTILSLSAIRGLHQDQTLKPEARKMLSFTDNRQDASLQAGHFNDFVEIGRDRGCNGRTARGPQGLYHDQLAQQVFDALNLPTEAYAAEPAVRYQAQAKRSALRNVLGYRLYRDLKRGWRITSPNLEQCGLLEIRYPALDEICQDEELWATRQGALATASPETRLKIAKVLLDFMRRELTIKVDYLDQRFQESIQQQSSQLLIAPWAIDENETMEFAAILFPRSRGPKDFQGNVYLSARGGFGQYLRRRTTFTEFSGRLSLADTDTAIIDLLSVLNIGGLVQEVEPPREKGDVPGYQLPASAIVWLAGDGTHAFHDPIRVPNAPEGGGRTNPFFVDFYQHQANHLQGWQRANTPRRCPPKIAEEREILFREGKLPILYCSPTMELGIDIKDLNVVNLRNIPPTPANYAQRSGRAGRSGQPALVFSYCATGSSHDQYFFKRPERMVAGAVTPPRLDLTNEDLVRAHIHAIWLAESHLSLGKSLKDILDVAGDDPTLKLAGVRPGRHRGRGPRQRARARAEQVIATFRADLLSSGWYHDGWLDDALTQVARRFDQTCDRWRGLYRSAWPRRGFKTKSSATRRAVPTTRIKPIGCAVSPKNNLRLLTDVENLAQSDFYSYRYFASEGFLPGYNFPRLPLSAYIPGRRTKQRDEFLSRPRFLAISEFGPRAIVYHEGSRYLINKVIMPVDGDEPLTHQAKRCEACGYLHPIVTRRRPRSV